MVKSERHPPFPQFCGALCGALCAENALAINQQQESDQLFDMGHAITAQARIFVRRL